MVIPIIYLCIPSMIGFIAPCLSHGITHLSDKAISWKGLQQNPIKADVFFIKYLPQNSCLHMFTLWNPSKCWCFGTSFSPWKTAMARGCTLFSIDQSGPTIHPGGDRSLWNCHMTRGESSSIHQPKKWVPRSWQCGALQSQVGFKISPENYRNYWFIFIIWIYHISRYSIISHSSWIFTQEKRSTFVHPAWSQELISLVPLSVHDFPCMTLILDENVPKKQIRLVYNEAKDICILRSID